MATTYTLISSNTLSASAASVTFSSIPSTYTDLVLKCSIRTDTTATADNARLTFNGTTANYSETYLQGDGSSATSGRRSNRAFINIGAIDDNGNTSNTFSSVDIYIPSYTASQNKPIGHNWAQEQNGVTSVLGAQASLWRDTTAISSLKFELGGSNFVSGSSFYLYGIKNS